MKEQEASRMYWKWIREPREQTSEDDFIDWLYEKGYSIIKDKEPPPASDSELVKQTLRKIRSRITEEEKRRAIFKIVKLTKETADVLRDLGIALGNAYGFYSVLARVGKDPEE